MCVYVCVRVQQSYHLNLPRVQLSRFCWRDGELDFPPFFGFHGALWGTRGIHDELSVLCQVSQISLESTYACLNIHMHTNTHTGRPPGSFLQPLSWTLLWFVFLLSLSDTPPASYFPFSYQCDLWFSPSQCLESVWASLYQPGRRRGAELRERMVHWCVLGGGADVDFYLEKKDNLIQLAEPLLASICE